MLFVFLLDANSKESKEWWIYGMGNVMNEGDLEVVVMGQ
jgi:hypothetical protein